MYVKVRVLAEQKKERIDKKAANQYIVSVKEKAEQNMANRRIVSVLAEEFGVSERSVRIVSGHHRPNKIFSVPDPV
jgi:uncharacterized protein YggU (UPF0235/DUF167 family)